MSNVYPSPHKYSSNEVKWEGEGVVVVGQGLVDGVEEGGDVKDRGVEDVWRGWPGRGGINAD